LGNFLIIRLLNYDKTRENVESESYITLTGFAVQLSIRTCCVTLSMLITTDPLFTLQCLITDIFESICIPQIHVHTFVVFSRLTKLFVLWAVLF
jgi:hypothetical protein